MEEGGREEKRGGRKERGREEKGRKEGNEGKRWW